MRALDENRNEILKEHGIEVRRARSTVVIGHPLFEFDYDEPLVNEVLRTQTSHHSRIDVITYKELLDNAARALELEESVGQRSPA